MAKVWTHGRWTVRPGEEEAFIAAWTSLARRAMSELDSGTPTLLRDRDRPNLFLTFGAWPSIEAVAAFRDSDAFREGVATMQPLLDSFEPSTLDEVAWS